MASPLFATKPVDKLVADTEEEGSQLKRAVGLLDLTALGIGAIIGTGIFVILGEAIGDAGPASPIASPRMTKIPVPMIAPMPSAVRSKRPTARLS